MSFPPVPKEIKPVAHLMKLAEDHEERNIVVVYWARMAACRLALKLTPGKKPPEVSALITSLLDWLEVTKKNNSDNEGITSETTAHALIEEYALKLFDAADKLDRAQIFDKNTVKTFYTCGMLMDVLEQFGLSDEIIEKRKYAKWKAAIIHNSLKNGERPMPGGPNEMDNSQNNVMHISQLNDEERAAFDEELKKLHDRGIPTKRLEDTLSHPDARPTLGPRQEDINFSNDFGHAPASSPVTPGVQPQPVPFTPQPETPSIGTPTPSSGFGTIRTPDQIQKAQKFCKYATSALNYDDVKTAVDNLRKALNLLEYGTE